MKNVKYFESLDADGAIFFARQLELIKSKSYDVIYADLKARQLFPVNNEGGPGITSITYRTYDQRATAKIINGYATDLPRADLGGKETTIPVKELGIAYGYNVKEVASASIVGTALDQRRANAAMRGNEEAVNQIAFYGDAEAGLPGFFSNTAVPRATAVNGALGQSEWGDKTPDEILFDLNDACTDIFETTKMIERPNTILLPPAQWSLISSTARSSTSDTTILEYFVTNSPYIASKEAVIPVNEMKGAGTGGVDVMVAYDRNPDKLQLEIPSELTFLPVQEVGLEFVVPGWSSIGGVNIYYPLSINIIEGI